MCFADSAPWLLYSRIVDSAGTGTGVPLAFADLSGQDFRGKKLYKADLRGTNFTNANMEGASLFGAFAKDAKFTGAKLGNADLESVDFENADLSDAVLEGAQVGVLCCIMSCARTSCSFEC